MRIIRRSDFLAIADVPSGVMASRAHWGGRSDGTMAVAAAIGEAIERQRQNFARELHDEFGQRLALLKMHSYRVRPLLDKAGAADAWRTADAEIDALIAHVRAMSGSLYPAPLRRLGLLGAVRDMLARHFEHSQIAWQFEQEGTPAGLHDAVVLALYRVVQESVTNIVRHAMACKVTVSLRCPPDASCIKVTIRDNGVGCANSAIGDGGNGQAGMRQRVEQLNGTLRVSASRRRGTTVIATIPLPGVSR